VRDGVEKVRKLTRKDIFRLDRCANLEILEILGARLGEPMPASNAGAIDKEKRTAAYYAG